jgi:hypothetical protein
MLEFAVAEGDNFETSVFDNERSIVHATGEHLLMVPALGAVSLVL